MPPHWPQPSHPSIQKVVHSQTTSTPSDFSTKSYSTITVAPYGVYTILSFPPMKLVDESDGGKSYATVQVGKDEHVDLGCDMLYTEHSCDPNLIYDTSKALSSSSSQPSISILAGPRGLAPGDELTFFYPSTEWDMAQGFDCHCGSGNCLGRVEGAKGLSREKLEGKDKRWIAPHIRRLVEERDGERWGDEEPGQAEKI